MCKLFVCACHTDVRCVSVCEYGVCRCVVCGVCSGCVGVWCV